MPTIFRFAVVVFVGVVLLAPMRTPIGAASWQWALADPENSQIVATQTDTGVVSIARVQLVNGCQEPFFVPGKTKFKYRLKIRTEEGVMCTQVIRDEYVLFFEKGTTRSVHVTTKSGVQRVSVKPAPTSAPTP